MHIRILEPLEHSLITQHKLPQCLHHTNALRAQISHRASDKVFVFRPHAGRRSRILEDIDAAVDGAESPRAATAGTAVYDDRPLPSVCGRILVDVVLRVVISPYYIAAMFDEGEDVCWVSGGAEVGPA